MSVTNPPRFGEQWLNQHQVGYVDLDEDDRTAIREFALLWSIFEVQALFGKSGVKAIVDYIDDLAKTAELEERKLLTAPFIPHLSYFREQYVSDDGASTNDLFRELRFENDNHTELVSHALIKLSDETPELTKALLIITHQLRSNLFRSMKWQRCSKKQRDDLYHASKTLMKAVDLSK